MIATLAATLTVCSASLLIGQAAVALCGCRHWSWLSPAIGLALVSAICWGTVRLPGDGLVSAIAVLLAAAASLAYLARGGGEWDGEWRLGLPVALAALLAASLPFFAEGHFGILGTGFNPDMSQHLLAGDRLAGGHGSELLSQGYPLGPHAIVVALNKGLGIGLVQGFDGLTVAVAVLAPLTALAAFHGERPLPRIAAALVTGLTYMVASYFAQGAFKETMQALFVLAFVISLREVARSPDWRRAPLRFVPAALIAVGSVYAYSYPGLVWLIGAAVIWVGIELLLGRPPAIGPGALRAGLLALLAFVVLIAPEVGRMVEFHNFETFDPNGPGLGNLFGQVSPAEALGIWPSGDFRLTPGDGAVPALGYYLGACFAGILFLYGTILCWSRREFAVLSGVVAVIAIYIAARVGGTPYTAAKAIVVASPVLALAILIPLVRRPAGWLYLLAAGGCALLALANAPVGPSSYSPALTGLRPAIAEGSTLYLASDRLLDEEHGERYVVWELRGGRVCVGRISEAGGRPPQGLRFVIAERGSVEDATGRGDESVVPPPFAGLRLRQVAGPYVLWEVATPPRDEGPCPLIAVRQARAAR
ncbi:MAG TPA: hypothetical protein VIT85_04335 [Solirubrobacterales bacterium]